MGDMSTPCLKPRVSDSRGIKCGCEETGTGDGERVIVVLSGISELRVQYNASPHTLNRRLPQVLHYLRVFVSYCSIREKSTKL